MKKWIAILFILAMCGTLLPGVLSYDQKKVVLFSTVEEEQPHSVKAFKVKEDAKALSTEQWLLLAGAHLHTDYANLFILFSDDPCLGIQTPPPDWFC
jgi:hypothetical protein